MSGKSTANVFGASASVLSICAALGLSGTAHAQDQASTSADASAQVDEEAVLDTVIVRGFRGSVEQALQAKRAAVNTTDSIVSEDVGKFPDLNLAEALQRTTGVAISRDNGEGQQVTLRGLGPEFTRVQLNGMSISSASIGGTGGATFGREFDFDLFPSELFSRIDIAKTPTADLEEGGIAGTMNLRTARPFDFGEGFSATASAQGGFGSNAKKFDPRGHILLSHRTDNWGITFQAAYSERNVQVEGSSSVDWTVPDLSSLDVNFPADTLVPPSLQAEVEAALFPRLPRTEWQRTERKRLGLAGAIEWRPSDRTNLALDLVYTKLDRNTLRSNLDAVFRNQRDIEVVDITLSGGAVQTGTFRNVERRSETREVVDETDLLQIALSGEHYVFDNFKLNGLVGFSQSEFDNPRTTTWLFQVVDSEVMLDFTDNPQLPSISTDVDLTNPDSYTTAALRIRPSNIKDESFTASLGAQWGEDNANLKFGAILTRFEKDRVQRVNDRAVNAPLVSAYSQPLPISDLASGIGNNGQFPSDYLIADMSVANTIEFTDRISGAQVTALGLSSSAVVSTPNSWNIEETTIGGYIEGNLQQDLNGALLSINAGARFVGTDQTSNGFSNGEVVSIDNSYSDVIPIVNLKLEFENNIVLRASAGQTITRPSLAELRPNTSVAIGNTGRGGNPGLQPFRSSQFDIGAEWYFEPGGALTFGAFYKNISGFIVSESETIPFGDLGIPLSSLDPQGFEGTTLDTPFTVTRPVNSDDPATLKGFEIALQKQFDELLDGLGFIVNYTYVDSEVQALSGVVSVSTTLPNLSKHSYNLTGYYENDRFSLRASYNWRDTFVESTFIRDATGLLRTREAAGFLDFSGAYNVTDRIALTFEGINLLDTEEYTFTGREDLFNRFIHTGPQFFIGARASW